jgi:hypothetical protein
MRRSLLTLALVLAAPLLARAEAKVYAPQPQESYRVDIDGLGRQEWNTRRFGDLPDEKRWRLRLLPRFELGRTWFQVGAGGDFNYSQDKNTEGVLEGTGTYRDNYDSRSARLDLAYLKLQPLTWLRVQGGRFVMPVGLTDMLWDHDLRPQGGALSVEFTGKGDLARFSATALAARGSHVFKDEQTNMVLFSTTAVLSGGRDSALDLTASYLQFTDFNKPGALDSRLFRQNAHALGGGLANEYRIFDAIGRLTSAGRSPMEVYLDYSWNTAVDQDNKGLWMGIVLGSLVRSRARLEYTYARVGREATLGAYSTTDFLWSTGWEGHRGEFGSGVGRTSSFHLIGQIQRFRASDNPAEASHWVRRLRIEWRVHASR